MLTLIESLFGQAPRSVFLLVLNDVFLTSAISEIVARCSDLC